MRVPILSVHERIRAAQIAAIAIERSLQVQDGISQRGRLRAVDD